MDNERRNHPRLKLRVPVELIPETSDAPTCLYTSDLSRSGCYIEMLFTLEIGTKLDMTFQLGDSILLVVGEVVTCDRNVGNGIRFTKMLREDGEELTRFIQAAEAAQQSADQSV
jgi:hypothetical protein